MKSKIRKQILKMCDTLRESMGYVKTAEPGQAYQVLCDCLQVIEAIERSVQKEFEQPLSDEYSEICRYIKDALECVNEVVQTGVSRKNAISSVRNGLRRLTEKLTNETQIQKTGKAIIFMCVYNTPVEYLREAVKSVLNQSDPDLLLLILDHGSTDGTTAETLKQFAAEDERIILFRCERNMKLTPEDDPTAYAAWEQLWNRIGQESGAEYFATLDSDDRYDPNFLKNMCTVAEACDADIAVCGTTVIREDGTVINTVEPPKLVANRRSLKSDEFIGLYNLLRTHWGKLYSTRYWKRFFLLFMRTLGKNGGDTLLVLNLICEIHSLLSVPWSLHFYRCRQSSAYHQCPSSERIGEGEHIFDEGVKCAKHYNCFSEKTELFLEGVFNSHISDLLSIAFEKEKPVESAQFVRKVLDSPLYQKLCTRNPICFQKPMVLAYNLLLVLNHEKIRSILNSPENESTLPEMQKMKDGLEQGDNMKALSANTALLMKTPLDESLLLYRLKIENRVDYKKGEAVYACIAETLYPGNAEIQKEADILKKKEIILRRSGTT